MAQDGSFQFPAVIPDRYDLSVGAGLEKKDIYAKRVTADEKAVSLVDLDWTKGVPEKLRIVVSDQGASIAGQVKDGTGRALENATVVAAPEDRRYWQLFRSIKTDVDGRYRIQGLGTGDYRVSAWTSVQPGEWLDRNSSKFVDGARRLHLDGATSVAVDFQVDEKPAGSQTGAR